MTNLRTLSSSAPRRPTLNEAVRAAAAAAAAAEVGAAVSDGGGGGASSLIRRRQLGSIMFGGIMFSFFAALAYTMCK
jgi:hypothetical protein